MALPIDLPVGLHTWPVKVPPERMVELRRQPIAPIPTSSARELVRDALEKPFGFEPLRRALTPDDRVAIVLEDSIPHAAELIAGVLDHLETGGIKASAVTVITPHGAKQAWIDELPDNYADLTIVTHDPADRSKLSYLATTQSERRIYLNRTLVESDFAILLTSRGYDPICGYSGAEAALFPDLADEELRRKVEAEISVKAPGAEPWPIRAEAIEIAWLLGTPFLIQVILGTGDTIQEIVAGLLNSGPEGIRRLDERWRGTVPEKADTVIATVSGDPSRVRFLDLALAAVCAGRVVVPEGRIAIVSDAAPQLGEGAVRFPRFDGPADARKRLAKEKPIDWPACYLWCTAAKRASLFLASGYPDDVVEELFSTAIRTPAEIQRLIDSGGQVLVIPDAHRSMVTVAAAE